MYTGTDHEYWIDSSEGEEESSRDSDNIDSEVEALLYSHVHHEVQPHNENQTGNEFPLPETFYNEASYMQLTTVMQQGSPSGTCLNHQVAAVEEKYSLVENTTSILQTLPFWSGLKPGEPTENSITNRLGTNSQYKLSKERFADTKKTNELDECVILISSSDDENEIVITVSDSGSTKKDSAHEGGDVAEDTNSTSDGDITLVGDVSSNDLYINFDGESQELMKRHQYGSDRITGDY